MDVWETDAEGLAQMMADPLAWPSDGPRVVLLDVAGADELALPFGMPVVVVGLCTDALGSSEAHHAQCDMVLGHDEVALVDDVVDTVGRNPVAASALVALLRTGSGALGSGALDAGLLAESATYAAGEEFQRWRSTHLRRPVADGPGGAGEPVLARRDGEVLHLTLHRPERRNALDVTMRDALAELLGLARVDATIRSIVLDGAGPAFCSGGDLDEFGTAADPSRAHLVRLERNLGALFDSVSDRMTVHLHGAAIGSGIELAAFAHRVLATPDVQIALPEVSMGLIPGAGGTVSVARRIGRHRLCRLALTGERIGLRNALEWGLVDGELGTPSHESGRDAAQR
ncbi:MAG TPA: enoyl-CoA hydratase/isomerase family protein [Microthrixaceae bacterium]|nr:enoyl-CoA hydratase/isomerase family protein [Microthrixaceae bacterium]